MSTKILTRREFLRVAALAGGGLVLAACSPVAPTTAPTVAPTADASRASVPTAVAKPTVAASPVPTVEQPQYGGILTFNQVNDLANFDPISNSSGSVLYPIAPCYNNLVMFDPLNPDKVIGDLAESWETTPDGKTLTFKLIKGVKFHDGKPFTSADVKYTFDIVRNPPQGVVSARKALLAVVSGIETPDDYTVRFVLKQPSSSFLTTLASGWMVVLPKHILEVKGDMKKDLVGTGPFKLKEYVPGVSLELVKNPDYHVKGRPYLDGLKQYVIPDPATTFANLRSGQLLQYDAMSGDDARRAAKEFGDKVVIQSMPSTSFVCITINAKNKPWDDIRVRQAGCLAIDRAAALKVAQGGDGALAGLSMPGPWSLPAAELEKIPGYGKDVAANLTQAKKLLAEAGYPNGFSTTLVVRNNPIFTPVALFVKDQWAQVGIEAKVDVRETAAFNDTQNKREFQVSPTGASFTANDPDVWGDYITSTGSQNYTSLINKEVDELFAKQSQTLDVEERKKLANTIEQTALSNYGMFFLYLRDRFHGFSRKVHDMKIHPNMDNVRRYQNVWLSKE